MESLEQRALRIAAKLRAVLCDPDGKCCIQGSDGDRAEVEAALSDLDRLMAEQGEPVGWIERIVRRGTPEYQNYINVRFAPGASTTFLFDGHRWSYKWSSFDDESEYDVIQRPAVSPPSDALETERKALREYGRHKNYCDLLDYLDERSTKCTCGLNELLGENHG